MIKLTDLRISMLTKREGIAEVRDPQTDELVDHMWVPRDEWVDLTPHVTTYTIRADDLDYPNG